MQMLDEKTLICSILEVTDVFVLLFRRLTVYCWTTQKSILFIKRIWKEKRTSIFPFQDTFNTLVANFAWSSLKILVDIIMWNKADTSHLKLHFFFKEQCGSSTEVKEENTRRQASRGQTQEDVDETLYQNRISKKDSRTLPWGILNRRYKHTYSPVYEHTVSLMHQRVLPSVRKAHKRGSAFFLFIFCGAVHDVICVLAPLISIQLKSTTGPRYTVAVPRGRHRQSYS